MKLLYSKGVPVPQPIDYNRYGIIMEYINAPLLANVKLDNPRAMYEKLMKIVINFAEV